MTLRKRLAAGDPGVRVVQTVFLLLLGGFVGAYLFLGREFVATEQTMGTLDGIGLAIVSLPGPLLKGPRAPDPGRTFGARLDALSFRVDAFSAFSDRDWLKRTGRRLRADVARIQGLERSLGRSGISSGQTRAVRTLSVILDRTTARDVLPALARLRLREHRLLWEFLWVIVVNLLFLYGGGRLLFRTRRGTSVRGGRPSGRTPGPGPEETCGNGVRGGPGEEP